MRKSNPRTAALLGLFLLGAAAILAAGILALGDLREALTSRIHVAASFERVNGLKPGDAVWFSGVPVGVVRRVDLLDDGSVEVGLAIDASAQEAIPADVVASLGSDGLIGNRIVVLGGGVRQSERIADGDSIGSAGGVSTEDLMAGLQKNSENLLAITEDLKVVTSALVEGEGTLGALLADEALYEDLSATASTLREVSSDAAGTGRELRRFASGLNEEGTLPHAIVHDTDTWPAVTRSVASLERSSEDASELVAALEASVGEDDTPIGVLLHDRGAGSDVEQTLANLDEGTELMNETLRAMQHNFLLRGYFKKKARREAEAREAEREATASADDDDG